MRGRKSGSAGVGRAATEVVSAAQISAQKVRAGFMVLMLRGNESGDDDMRGVVEEVSCERRCFMYRKGVVGKDVEGRIQAFTVGPCRGYASRMHHNQGTHGDYSAGASKATERNAVRHEERSQGGLETSVSAPHQE